MAVKICCHCSKEINENARECPYCKTIVFDNDDDFDTLNLEEKESNKTLNIHDDNNLVNLNSDDDYEKSNEEILKELFYEEERFVIIKRIAKFFHSFTNVIRDPRKYISYVSGMIGCFFMVFGGMFCTYYCTIDNVALGESYLKRDAFFMVMLSVASGLFIVKKLLKFSLISVIIATVFLADLAICFFNMEEFEYVGAGFIFWCLGTVFLLLSVVFISKQNRHVGQRGRNLKPFIKYDFIWCAMTLIFALCIVKSVCNHEVKVYSGINNKTSTSVSKEVDMTQGKVNINVEGAYKTKYNNKNIVIIALKLKNMTNSSIVFDKNFVIDVYQNTEELSGYSNINIPNIDMSARNNAVDVGKEEEMFFTYILNGGTNVNINKINNIKVSIQKINVDDTSIVIDDLLALKSAADDVAASKYIYSKNIDSSGNSERNTSSKEDTCIVKFKKPSNWGDKVFVNVFTKDKRSNAKSFKVEMKKNDEDLYEYVYDKNRLNNYYINLCDEKGNFYPNNKELALSGNMDIRP